MTRTTLLDLYRTMVTIRLCEEAFVPHILDGTIRCPVHLYSGQEAIAAGLCGALTERDYVLGTHRSHGHFLAKGGALKALVAEVFCREDGCSRGRGGSMHLVDPDKGMLGSAPIVAGTISLALGAALAARIRRDGRVVVAFFGDGATGQGVLFEAMNFASLRKLPIVFACENNLYSTHMPVREIRVSNPIAALGAPFGIPACTVDGNDVVASYECSTKVVAACRGGQGPALIEFLTYRMRGHVGANDNIQGTQTDIRPQAEIDQWRAKDPIARFERQLLASDGASAADLSAIRNAVEREVADAFACAAASPHPDQSELNRYVFHN